MHCLPFIKIQLHPSSALAINQILKYVCDEYRREFRGKKTVVGVDKQKTIMEFEPSINYRNGLI